MDPKEQIEQQIEHDIDTLSEAEEIRYGESVAERLYDVNPDMFADMPTKEFMELFKELVKFDDSADRADRLFTAIYLDPKMYGDDKFLRKYGEAKFFRNPSTYNHVSPIEYLAEQLEARTPLSEDDKINLEKFLKRFRGTAEVDGSIDELTTEFDSDVFDKTPRQVIEELQKIVYDYGEFAKRRVRSAKQSRQAFLDQFKPDTPSQGSEKPDPAVA